MEDKALLEKVDIERWRLNAGLISQDMKNNLFAYGSIVHKDVSAVEVDINIEVKQIAYKIYCPDRLLKKVKAFNKLRGTKSLWGMWRLASLLKKEGNLDFQAILDGYINTLCGKPWKTTVDILPDSAYVADAIESIDGNQIAI